MDASLDSVPLLLLLFNEQKVIYSSPKSSCYMLVNTINMAQLFVLKPMKQKAFNEWCYFAVWATEY